MFAWQSVSTQIFNTICSLRDENEKGNTHTLIEHNWMLIRRRPTPDRSSPSHCSNILFLASSGGSITLLCAHQQRERVERGEDEDGMCSQNIVGVQNNGMVKIQENTLIDELVVSGSRPKNVCVHLSLSPSFVTVITSLQIPRKSPTQHTREHKWCMRTCKTMTINHTLVLN